MQFYHYVFFTCYNKFGGGYSIETMELQQMIGPKFYSCLKEFCTQKMKMDWKYEELKGSNLETLNDIREQWACRDLITRGNNTRNPIEAQFSVIKDDILNRTKEVNINGLLKKLVFDLMDHYKQKLLNISSGTFDGCYSNRFKGKK